MLTKNKVHDKNGYYDRHKFPLYIKKEITRLHKLNNWHGLLQVGEDWFWISLAISGSLVASDNFPLAVATPAYLASIFIIGARQRGLRVNNHQGTHKGLAKNKWLNYFLSTVLCSWLTLESFSGFDDTHNSRDNGHHPNLGTAKDVDHMAVVNNGLYDGTKSIYKFLSTLPLQTPKYISFLLNHRIFNPREDLRERVVRLTYFSIIAASLVYFGYGQEFVLYWLVPLFTTANWIGSFIQVSEHYPLMMTAKPIDIALSRNRILNPFWNFFFGTHQEGYHMIHHLYPKLPLWNMKKAHQILMRDPEYAALHEKEGMKELIKSLRLNS